MKTNLVAMTALASSLLLTAAVASAAPSLNFKPSPDTGSAAPPPSSKRNQEPQTDRTERRTTMRKKLVTIARAIGRYTVVALSSPSVAAAAGGMIILDAPAYSTQLLRYPGPRIA